MVRQKPCPPYLYVIVSYVGFPVLPEIKSFFFKSEKIMSKQCEALRRSLSAHPHGYK